MNNNSSLTRSKPIKFKGPNAFYNYVKQAVDRYFRLSGAKPHDNLWQYGKAFVLLSWLAVSYVALVFLATTWWQACLGALSLALAMASVSFCIQHDGNHGSFSRFKVVNKLAGLTLDMLGGSSYIWGHKHNTIHHTYTNVVGHDDDIETGSLARLAPSQPRRWFHRFQHIYLWFLYGFIVAKWHLVDDFTKVIKGRIGTHRLMRPQGKDLMIFILGKIVFFSLVFVVPLFAHSLGFVLLFYAITSWCMGVIIAVVFQLAHVVEESQFPLPDTATGHIAISWAEHQVLTTVDFAPRNKVLTWLLGGLNFQIEHHLFPKVAHVHYPRISRLVERACKKFNLPYHSHSSLVSAIASHFRLLRQLGKS